MNRAIFLDRDGTINQDSKDYIKSLDEFKIFPCAIDALIILQELGYLLIIITNQSGIGRGFFNKDQLQDMHNFMMNSAKDNGVLISDIYVCPHLPEDNCQCRKPKIANLEIAQIEHDIDLKKSWFIGDSEKDIITGKNAACKTILVLSGVRGIREETTKNWQVRPDYIVKDILEAAQMIKRMEECK